MATKHPERRLNPRIDIDSDISYKTDGSEEIRDGLLENLSLDGARIWIGQELPTESQLIFRVEAGSPDEDDLEFRATLLHMLPRQEASRYGYGCRIELSADRPVDLEQVRLNPLKEDS